MNIEDHSITSLLLRFLVTLIGFMALFILARHLFIERISFCKVFNQVFKKVDYRILESNYKWVPFKEINIIEGIGMIFVGIVYTVFFGTLILIWEKLDWFNNRFLISRCRNDK